MSEIQSCHACPHFDRETGVCHLNQQPVHENVYRLGCPDGKFPSRDVPVLRTHRRTTLSEPPAEGLVLDDRRAVCEACPIGSFDGWAGPSVVKCREICRPCNTQGLINIAIHKCPRGHHEV